MTREETIKILMVMQAAYPNYKPQDKTVAVNLWCDMLSDYSYEQVMVALKAYIRTDKSGFAPVIGDIVDRIQTIFGEEELNESEAWNLVWKAICNSGYHEEEEFEKLPEAVKRAVGSPSQLRQWALSEVKDDTISVWRSSFQRVYRIELQKQKQIEKLSPDIMKLVQKNGNDLKIESKKNQEESDSEKPVPMPDSVRNKFNQLFKE